MRFFIHTTFDAYGAAKATGGARRLLGARRGLMTGPAAWRSRWPRGRQDGRGVALVFPAIREGRRHRRRRLSPAHRAGKGCSPDFPGPCWANDVQSRLRSPRGPPVGHFRRGDSCRGGRHPCSRAERRPDLTAGEYGRSSRFNPVLGPRQKANRAAALRFEQARCARRAREGHAARCSRAAKRCGAAQGTDDAIGTVGGAANGRIDAARDIAPARGSEQAIRRGRATSMARDGGRSVGGAGDASRSRHRARRRASARSIRGRSRRRRQLGTGGGAAKGRIGAARDIAPARGSNHAVHRGRATSTARDDGRSVGGAGDGARSRIAPDGARAFELSVGGAGDGASFRIAPDDAAALGAGQSDRHRFAGALERGSATASRRRRHARGVVPAPRRHRPRPPIRPRAPRARRRWAAGRGG